MAPDGMVPYAGATSLTIATFIASADVFVYVPESDTGAPDLILSTKEETSEADV